MANTPNKIDPNCKGGTKSTAIPAINPILKTNTHRNLGAK